MRRPRRRPLCAQSASGGTSACFWARALWRPAPEALTYGVGNFLGSARPPAYELLIGVDRVVRRQGRCARSEQPTPAEKPPYRHSPKLGLNSGRELTVQELSLYRPAPFRTPVERA